MRVVYISLLALLYALVICVQYVWIVRKSYTATDAIVHHNFSIDIGKPPSILPNGGNDYWNNANPPVIDEVLMEVS